MKDACSAGAAAVGLRLRQQRLKRGWSQEGLCRGICAASYLSKIEQGRVQAAPELLALLMKRMDLPWYGENLPELEELVERRYALLLPEAYCFLMAGIAGYEQGGDYVGAMAYLRQGCDLAARDGRVRLMLECRLFMGSVCCNRLDLDGMEEHYQAAERMARALGRQEDLRAMAYNRAATQVECGRYQEAYGYFAALEHPRVMELHKLAVCCEGLGRTREALDALDRAETAPEEYPDRALCMGICGLVRRRLENPGYLRDPDYGAALMDVFNRCRRELPIGYAAFHLPRVLEWLTAGRQYKQAYELLRDFPIKLPNLPV